MAYCYFMVQWMNMEMFTGSLGVWCAQLYSVYLACTRPCPCTNKVIEGESNSRWLTHDSC